jgi:CubicO group peptidase (beta-lactamase class C family)
MLRIVLGAIGAVLAICLAALNLSPIGQIYLPSGTGIVAKQLCSMVFVSELDSDYARQVYLDPLTGDAGALIQVNVDRENRTVGAGILGGLWRQQAQYRDGLGCTLTHGDSAFDPDLALPPAHDFQPLPLDTAHRDAHFDTAALAAALNAAFDDPQNDLRNTLGVAVLHQGRLVAEHYAPQASRETRFLGWSMTKSAAATLAGVLVQDGALALDTVPALLAAQPDRNDITIEHLLRMTGGLAIEEAQDGTDPTSDMLFLRDDMAGFAASRERLYAPGEHWEYMSGNTVLATQEMQSRLGDGLPAQIAALRSRLFDPLAMYSVVIEPDASGTLVGSSYMYATAHDWARLAQLYLDGGRVGERQLIPADWPEIVATPTPALIGDYGLGFWMPLEHDNLPAGTFMMNGFQSQLAMILPEQELVIVRFGATNGRGAEVYNLTRAVIAALHEDSPAEATNTKRRKPDFPKFG